MRRISNTTLRSALIFSTLLLLLPLHSSWAQTACTYSLGGCQCNCDGLSSLPPQSPYSRTYDDFIVLAYLGAYGSFPNCDQRQLEYGNLAGASYSSSALLEEAKRFVSTLFETQDSYDTPGLGYYYQTTRYELRNPAWQTDRGSLEAFIGDLYASFLQRGADQGGQCFWTNSICSDGRKQGIEAFKVSIEFGNLVNGLFDGGEPCPPVDPCESDPWSCQCNPQYCQIY